MKFFILVSFFSNLLYGENITFSMEKNGEILTNKISIERTKNFSQYEQYKIDSIVGNGLSINSNYNHEVLRSNGEVVFKYSFQTNEFGFRASPEIKSPKSFIVLAGDSNTFGEGLSDQEISSYFLSQKLPDIQVINWGRRGGAPHDFLAFLMQANWKKSISQQSGVFIYHFIPDYMWYRIIGSKTYMTWGESSPYFQLENNQVQLKGTFHDRWITSFYQFLNRNRFLNKYIKELPRISDSDLYLSGKIFESANKIIQEKMPNSKMIVVIDNCFNNENTNLIDKFIIELKKLNIDVRYLKAPQKNLSLPYEGHLNSEGHKRFADEIYNYLK